LTITAGSATLVSGDLNIQLGTLTVDTLASVPHTSFTLVDSGTIAWFAGSAAPTGWLECNGGTVSRTTYADLFAIVGSTYGVGDGSTTFNLPAQARNTLVGKGGSGTGTLANTTGSSGGEEAHTLSTSEIPSHSHTYQIGEIISKAYSGTTYNAPGEITGLTAATTGATGSGTAYSIMQPSLVMMMIIKT
jgi:microcystin-dependent protein